MHCIYIFVCVCVCVCVYIHKEAKKKKKKEIIILNLARKYRSVIWFQNPKGCAVGRNIDGNACFIFGTRPAKFRSLLDGQELLLPLPEPTEHTPRTGGGDYIIQFDNIIHLYIIIIIIICVRPIGSHKFNGLMNDVTINSVYVL